MAFRSLPNCLEVDKNGLCAKCASRFYNANGVCNQVTENCKVWHLNTGACFECFEGFIVSDKVCILKPAAQSSSSQAINQNNQVFTQTQTTQTIQSMQIAQAEAARAAQVA
jgi:hypothetical protein